MPEILQIRSVLNGFSGAPGYAQHYFFGDPVNTAQVNSEAAAVRAFWVAMAAQMPTGVTISLDTDCSILDEATGDLIRTMAADPVSNVSGLGSGTYAGGVGACISWVTGAVHGRKRLRGRTFVVPLSSNCYENNGSIVDSVLTNIRAGAATFAADAGFGVWGRPLPARTSASGESLPAAPGKWAGVDASNVRDKVAILRSRRD